MSSHPVVGSPRRSEKIKIAFVIDTVDARTGGTESQLLYLLERIDRDRFEPVLFCLKSSSWLQRGFQAAELRILDIHVSMSPRLLSQIWGFSRLLKRERFGVVQTHFRDGNLVGVLAGWLAGIEVIISTRRGIPYWRTWPGLMLLRWLNRHVTWFIANSVATKQRFAREEGFDAARVEVIYNGLDPSRFAASSPQERTAVRESLGLPADAPTVGLVANLRAVKGLRDFLTAAHQVAKTVPAARFVIVGEGDEEQALRALARRLELQDRVLFLGVREDVPRLLQAFDVGVLASHFESFSNSLLEYVAAGLPVVVTDVGGAREVVQEGRTGFIVPPREPARMAERLEYLLTQPSGARSWRKHSGLGDAFRLDSMVRGHERLYARLIGQAQGLPYAAQPQEHSEHHRMKAAADRQLHGTNSGLGTNPDGNAAAKP